MEEGSPSWSCDRIEGGLSICHLPLPTWLSSCWVANVEVTQNFVGFLRGSLLLSPGCWKKKSLPLDQLDQDWRVLQQARGWQTDAGCKVPLSVLCISLQHKHFSCFLGSSHAPTIMWVQKPRPLRSWNGRRAVIRPSPSLSSFGRAALPCYHTALKESKQSMGAWGQNGAVHRGGGNSGGDGPLPSLFLGVLLAGFTAGQADPVQHMGSP